MQLCLTAMCQTMSFELEAKTDEAYFVGQQQHLLSLVANNLQPLHETGKLFPSAYWMKDVQMS